MEILKNVLGEYIYITRKSYPLKAYFYKDKEVIKTLEIKSISEFVNAISTKMQIQNCQFVRYIIDNEENINEVVIDKIGILKFTIGVNNE